MTDAPTAFNLAGSAFGPDTIIDTEEGPLPFEWLVPGHRVLTRDNGLQPVLWTGATPAARLAGVVTIPAGALGDGIPLETVAVAPGHLVLVRHPAMELCFGMPEVFVRARDLTGAGGAEYAMAPADSDLLHVAFGEPQIVETLGLASAAPDIVGRMPRVMLLDASEARLVRDMLDSVAPALRRSA